jgi:hypothetical protein
LRFAISSGEKSRVPLGIDGFVVILYDFLGKNTFFPRVYRLAAQRKQ